MSLKQEYYWKPDRFCQNVLGVRLWSKQREILRSIARNRKTVVPSGHGCGKTFAGACAALWFLFCRPPAKVITTAPTWHQVKNLMWADINSLFKARLSPRHYPGEMMMTGLRVEDDWFGIGISPREAVSFQGFHQEHVLVILDEAPGVRREIYEGADSLLSTGDAHMLMIGNPTSPQGHFYQACRSEEWHKIHVSCVDSPNFTDEGVSAEVRRRLVSREWVEEKRREWGEDSPLYQSRVLGNFPVEDDGTLIPLLWAERATAREVIDNGRPRLLGVDVARFGRDNTVYVGIFGARAEILAFESGRDTMEVAGRTASLCREHGITAVAIDDIGVGGGVSDRLRELNLPGVSILPVNAGEEATDSERFVNRRAELWWLVREWLRDTGQIPNDERLLADVTAPKYSYTSRGQIKLESKEDTKRRLGRSPDFGDALMLTFAARGFAGEGWFGRLDLSQERRSARF